MQIVLGVKQLGNGKEQNKANVKLTKRDMEICKFLLEMKFASVEEIHKKFFKITLLGFESKGFRPAWKRLQNLESLGFIKALHHFQFLKRFYIPTLKGYNLIRNCYSSDEIPYPSKNIDIRTFDHDLRVTEVRLALENKFHISKWKSDRLLRSLNEYSSLIRQNLVPDGIFLTSDNKRVCFEFEKATKAKSRYLSKIKAYVSIMREQNSKLKLFDTVLYVCENKIVFEYLCKETKIYGELFKVQTIDQILSSEQVS